MKSRIMLVDDHAIVRAGLRGLIEQQPDMEVVAEAEETTRAFDLAVKSQPDVIVSDLNIPGGGGLSLVRQLCARGKPPRILVLSVHDDLAYVKAALAAGATGYVVKAVGEATLLAGIRGVIRGQLFVDLDNPERTSRVVASLTGQVSSQKLSERELEVLVLLGRGHSNQDIADKLELSPKTVATYKARLGDKLGLHTTAEFVKYVADNGMLEVSR